MRPPNFLLVGDVHATPNELDDCKALIRYITAVLQESRFDYVVFLGDQAHNHAILNVHVLNFWKESFLTLKPFVKDIICLVGNHDLPGITGSTNINSMSTLDHLAIVVDDHLYMEDILFVGHKAKNEDFIKICHDFSEVRNVICHQTFDGAIYDNGFLAPDGIKLEDLPKDQRYYSGHIHTPSEFGNVTYIGAPRWRTLADANARRHLARFDVDFQGIKEYYNTGYACRQITVEDIHLENEDSLSPLSACPNALRYINLFGPQSLIDKQAILIGEDCIVRKFPTDTKTIQVRESEGINKALLRFIDSSNTQTDKETLKKLCEERIWTKT